MNKAPILILHGSRQPYLSIGCRFGGVKAFNYEYIYFPIHDAFLRKDYLKQFKKHNKEKKSWEAFIEFLEQEK